MIKESFSPEFNKSLLGELAKKAISDLKSLPLPEETKKKIAKRHNYPLPAAYINFKFIENSILPIISKLCFCANDSDENLKISFRTKFGPFSAFNPEHKVELVVYNGIDLFLCLSKKNERSDFVPFKKINKNHFVALYNKRGEEAEAIRTFGEMSKKEIVVNVIDTIGSMAPQDSIISDSEPINPPNEHRHFSIRNLFAGHKN